MKKQTAKSWSPLVTSHYVLRYILIGLIVSAILYLPAQYLAGAKSGEAQHQSPRMAQAFAAQAGSFQFLTGTLAINEVNGSVSLAVTRTGNVAAPATVNYATTANGTATPDLDYTQTNGTLSFAEGEASKTLTISVNIDSITEQDETIEINLSEPTGAGILGTPSTAVVTIVDPRSTTQPGRILTSSGSASGGIIEFNTNGSNGLNLTSNNFDTGCSSEGAYKNYHPSVSRDGRLIAFASNRDPNSSLHLRIFVMNHDGTNVRQLTFNVASDEFDAGRVNDTNPVISPDGTRVAFISNRSVHTFPQSEGCGSPSGCPYRPKDIYIVNTDGTNLRRVTSLQLNERGGVGSNIVNVAWSPDGTTLAFRGVRTRSIEDPPGTIRIVTEQVVSTISADSTNSTSDTVIDVLNSTGQSESLDWSPDGRYLGLVWGGEAQGAAPRRVIIYDLQIPAGQPGNRRDLLAGQNLTDIFRFSPDSQKFVVSLITDFNFGHGVLASMKLDGSERSDLPRPAGSLHEPLWWQPGAPITAPARLELGPDPALVWSSHSVQMLPTLFDANGNIIARAATAWAVEPCAGGTTRINNTGLLSGVPNVNYSGQVCASNGGVSDCATFDNSDIPTLSVSATTPETKRSGTGGPGVFTITRAGNSSVALVISFALSGTAVRDVDYTLDATGGTVSGDTFTLPPNQTTATINLRPVSNSPGTGDKSAILTLQPDPSNFYFLNSQAKSAQVLIHDDVIVGTPTPTPTPTTTPTPALSLSAITPNVGGDEGSVTATIYGANIQPGASVKLSRTGQEDIPGTIGAVAANGFNLTTTFNLTGREQGAWDVVVTNPDTQTATLPNAFTIQQARGAEVWVDVVGRYTLRSGLTERFYIAYGNRGDVDTEPTMVRVSIPESFDLVGLPTLADGSVPAIIPEGGGITLEFYLNGIPAGSSSYLPLSLTADPNLAHQNVKIRAYAISSPALQQTVDVQPDPTLTYTSELIEKTDNYSKTIIRGNSATDSFDIVHEVMIEDDTQARPQTLDVVENGDTVKYIFSVSVAQTSSSSSLLSHMARRAGPQQQYKKISEVITRKYTKDIDGGTMFKQVTWMRVNRQLLLECMIRKDWLRAADAEDINRRVPAILTLTITRTIERRDNQPDILKQNKLFDQGFWDFIAGALGPNQLAFMSVNGENIPPAVKYWVERAYSNQWDQHVLAKLIEAIVRECECGEGDAGSQAHAKALMPANAAFNPQTCSACSSGRCQIAEKEANLEIVFSFDPNDKVGTQGAGEQHYINGADPINYSIFFENKPEATAPAQKVVITDQLDTSKLDLSTFSLGAFSFGDTVVAAPPGLSDYTTDVDLRPAKNLVVRINSELDEATGLLRVEFTSLDPVTMQPTTDPLAGFLPPNDNSPEGQGSVIFSIAPKSSLQTGDEIRNKARIIFDQNEPIDTPEWLNTIDKSKPESQVAPLAATQCGSFNVNWGGTDTGAGIQSYSVYVAEDGGAYTLWQLDTTDTHATFTGQAGKSYSFYSVARDGAGNTEDVPANADATTAITNAAALSITAPPDMTFETAEGATTCGLLIEDAALGNANVTGGCSTPALNRTGVPAGNIFPVGTTTITYKVTDGSGGEATAMQTITVLDKTPPVISSVSINKTELWPANHKMVDIMLGYDVTENCDGQSAITRTISVTSNEPVDGTGDGDAAPDWEVIDAFRLKLRAERSGSGQGRTYTITVTATDNRGNSSSRSVMVKVPKGL